MPRDKRPRTKSAVQKPAVAAPPSPERENPLQAFIPQPSTLETTTSTTGKSWLNQPFFGKPKDETILYVKNVEAMLAHPTSHDNDNNEEEDTPDTKKLLEEIRGQEMQLASDYEGSRYIERTLKNANQRQMRIFIDAIVERVVDVATHRFASHVLQTVLTLIPKFLEEPEPQISNEDGVLHSIPEFVLMIADKLSPSPNLMRDPYGSHILASLFHLLIGQTYEVRSSSSEKFGKEKNKVNIEEITKGISVQVPQSFSALLSNIVVNLISPDDATARRIQREDITKLPTHATGVISLTALLETTKNIDLINLFLEKGEEWILSCSEDKVGSHFMCSLIKMIPEEVLKSNLAPKLTKHLLRLAKDPIGNFVYQELLIRSPDSALILPICQEMSYFIRNRVAVVLKIAEVITDHHAELVNAIYSGLGTASNSPTLLSDLIAIHPHVGPQLVRAIFAFPPMHSLSLHRHIWTLDAEVIKALALDAKGSFVLQRYLLTTHPMSRIIKNLMPYIPELVVSGPGSHVLESMYERGDMKAKDEICYALSRCHGLFKGAAKHVAHKVDLKTWRDSSKSWRDKASKKKWTLDIKDILGEDGGSAIKDKPMGKALGSVDNVKTEITTSDKSKRSNKAEKGESKKRRKIQTGEIA